MSVPSLSDLETIVIDGAPYEAFTTSGGVGTMCETFAGRVDRLDYKTIRYPGHCQLMRFMLQELGLGRQREEAMRLLGDAYPPVRDDLVIVYAAADGNSGGRRAREEFVRVYRPRIAAGAARTAIAWTTAAGAVGMVELLAEGSLPDSGFVARKTCRSTPSSPPLQVRCSRVSPTRRCATTYRCCQSLETRSSGENAGLAGA